MKTANQFWALLKFQSTINPFIWAMPIAFGLPLFLTRALPDSYHPSLSSLLTVQNLFFVGIFGSMVIAPERFQWGAANAAWNPGSEFLLTRAIDRPILYRSKATFLYVLVLLMPLMSVYYSLEKPDLRVTEYSDAARQQCLSNVPGSRLEKDPSGNRYPLIFLPRGNVLIEEWHCWSFLAAIVGVQVLLLLLYALKYRILFFYVFFMGSIFVPLIWDLLWTFHNIHVGKPTSTSLGEGPFFFFASHQLLFWSLTALAVIAGQLWCERRFAQLEQ
jgi:hypothetical protein